MPPLPQPHSKLPPTLLALLSIAGFCILLRVHSFSFPFSSYSGTTKSVSIATAMTSSSSMSTSCTSTWKPLGPDNFPSVVSSEDGCRYAKDDEYLQAVLDSWNQDIVAEEKAKVETSPWIYHDNHGTPLYGHIVRPIATKTDSDSVVSTNNPLRPGILLFHTAAGPQDVFLFQQAAKLASSDLGCVVLICDVLSDRDGWAWSPDGDRTRFNAVKEELLRDKARGMRSRVEAAVRVIVGHGHEDVNANANANENENADVGNGLGVDARRLASLGWCFGAQPILELAALQHQQDRDVAIEGSDGDALAVSFSATALVSYHGVYRRVSGSGSNPDPSENGTKTTTTDPPEHEREVLVCTGTSDPFVSRDDLEFARATMGDYKYAVRILEFDGAKHGFTNPAQDFNTNPAFQYNENAATKSWEATMELLKRKL